MGLDGDFEETVFHKAPEKKDGTFFKLVVTTYGKSSDAKAKSPFSMHFKSSELDKILISITGKFDANGTLKPSLVFPEVGSPILQKFFVNSDTAQFVSQEELDEQEQSKLNSPLIEGILEREPVEHELRPSQCHYEGTLRKLGMDRLADELKRNVAKYEIPKGDNHTPAEGGVEQKDAD